MIDIKFRQWCGKNYEYWGLNVNGFEFSGPSSGIGFNASNTKHEQFTGIKDANGVDVYESDITEDHVGIGVVEFCEKYAAFRVNYKNGRCKWFYDYTLKGERESITVIGNINQHAYLLEQNK